MTRIVYHKQITDKTDYPNGFCPAEELLRAIVRQAALDVVSGTETRAKENRQIQEKYYNYHIAKLWLENNLDLFMFAAGISYRQAKTFIERN